MNEKEKNLQEHFEMAESVEEIERNFNKLYKKVCQKYPNSSLKKKLVEMHPKRIGSNWQTIKSELDKEYHNLINNEEFYKYGHIYYHKAE